MEIYLLRHAAAEDPIDHSEAADAARALTKEGREKAKSVAMELQKRVKHVDIILHSPLRRAVQTAECFAPFYNCVQKELEGLKPTDDPNIALDQISRSGNERVLIVGHEPNLSILGALLLTGNKATLFSFKKCGVAGFEWNGKNAHLLFLLSPKFLL